MLREYGHRVIPVHPVHKEIEGIPATGSLELITEPVDTVSVYVSPARGTQLIPSFLTLHPRRVILNPGAESEELEHVLQERGIEVQRACTLVLLRAGSF
jgi:predicted CoA-binding protein